MACEVLSPEFFNSSFTGIQLMADTASEIWVAGVTDIQPYARDANTIDVKQGGYYDITVKGTGKIGTITATANEVKSDPGQVKLRYYYQCNTNLGPGANLMKIYRDTRSGQEVFIALDLAANPDGAIRVLKAVTPGSGVNAVWKVNYEFVVEGTPCEYIIHYTDPGAPDITFGVKTIIDAQAGFVTQGFVPGMSVLIGGVGTPNTGKYATIDTVAAGLLTMVEATPFTADAVGSALTVVHGGNF